MSESKKYTLPRVLEIVRGHAVALFAAAEGLDDVDGKDPDILALVGERALKASVDLWAIENIVGTNRGKIAEWNDSTRIYRSLFTLPTLALAVEAAGTDPHTVLSVDEPWSWCRFQTSAERRPRRDGRFHRPQLLPLAPESFQRQVGPGPREAPVGA